MRAILAQAAVYLCFAVFVGYGVYGLYLDLKAGTFRLGAPPRGDPWNAAYYRPEAAPWLARNRRWRRWLNWVWIGSIVLGNLLYYALRP